MTKQEIGKMVIRAKFQIEKFNQTNIKLQELEIKCYADMENEELENDWDEMYKENYNALTEAAKLIETLTSGFVSLQQAKSMIVTRPEDLKRIFNIIED